MKGIVHSSSSCSHRKRRMFDISSLQLPLYKSSNTYSTYNNRNGDGFMKVCIFTTIVLKLLATNVPGHSFLVSAAVAPPLSSSTRHGTDGTLEEDINSSFLRKSDFPYLYDNNHGTSQWTSVAHTVEFLPAHSIDWKKYHPSLVGMKKSLNKQQQQQQQKEEHNSRQLGHGEQDESSDYDRARKMEIDHDHKVRSTGSSRIHQKKSDLKRLLGGSNDNKNNNNGGASANDYYRSNPYGGSSVYATQPFVAASDIEYDSYQQAWRLLGFMIDCDSDSSYYNNNNNHDNHNNNRNSLTGEGCQRYVIWAAYVDLDYEGGGIGEYQYWDREKKAWDTNSCKFPNYNNNNNKNNNNKNNYYYYNNNNNNKNNKNENNMQSRCAKMDCHLPDTNWKLLGFFKHRSLDDWMGQLFKHEGMCIWSDDEYSFMKNARKAWPSGCSVSNTVTESSQPIYYDVKPVSGGGITLGLYTDTRCTVEYQRNGKNDPISVESVVGNILLNSGSHDSRDNKNNNNKNNDDGSSASFEETLAYWDSAFNAFKICQPCVAYDINNWGYNNNDDAVGSAYGTYRYGYNDDYAWRYWGYYRYKGSDFDCYDDAGYTNVNQCMKFMAKTTMNTATFRDLSLANLQGTLVDYPMAGFRDGSISYMSSSYNAIQGFLIEYMFLLSSLFVLVYGSYKYLKVKREMKRPPISMKQPLV